MKTLNENDIQNVFEIKNLLSFETYFTLINGNTDDEQKYKQAKREFVRKQSQLLVTDGAQFMCGTHKGTFHTNYKWQTINNKGVARQNDVLPENFTFEDGFQIISIESWQRIASTTTFNDEYPLLFRSTIKITGKMPGNNPPESYNLQFLTAGQNFTYEDTIDVAYERSVLGEDTIKNEDSINNKSNDIKTNEISKQKCFVEFRPNETFKWEYGIDWMRLGREGDNKINFTHNCGGARKNPNDKEHPIFFENIYKFKDLEKEYRPIEIDISDWKKKPTINKCYCTWLALYPETAMREAHTATLDMLVYADEVINTPLKFDYNSYYFEITPNEITSLPKSKKGTIIKNAITIKCKYSLDTEQEIKLVTTDGSNTVVGRIFVVPNNKLYKVPIQLVNVLLFKDNIDKEKKELKDKIKWDSINDFLTTGALKNCFILPEIKEEILTFDLTANTDEYKQNFIEKISVIDSKKITFFEDSYFRQTLFPFIQRYYYNKAATDGEIKICNTVIFFINYNSGILNRGITNDGRNTEQTKFTDGLTKNRYCIITQRGVNQETISHEILHRIGLLHTFDIDSTHILKEHTTDNIMDYKVTNSKQILIATYKWQWMQIIENLKKDNEIKIQLQ